MNSQTKTSPNGNGDHFHYNQVFTKKNKAKKLGFIFSNTILQNYKGSSLLEVGFVFAPYVPLITTPVFKDDVLGIKAKKIGYRVKNVFSSKKGLISKTWETL